MLGKAGKRRYLYLRPGSRRNQLNYFKTFLVFACYYDISIYQLDPQVICAYIEFLLHSYPCPGTVKNYVSGLSVLCAWLGLDREMFSSFQVKQMWRAVELTVRYKPTPAPPLDLYDLQVLIEASTILGAHQKCFISLITLLFFTMSRISTFLPRTESPFDSTRNLTVGDVQVTEYGLNIFIKWAKNVQQLRHAFVIPIYRCSNSVICPVLAFMTYMHVRGPGHLNAPLYVVKKTNLAQPVPLTIFVANRWLRLVLNNSQLHAKQFSFHSFRRGACTTAFASGAPIEDIKYFGNWRSDSVLAYLSETPARRRVARLLST